MEGSTFITSNNDQVYKLELSFSEMHFIMNALSVYQHSNAFWEETTSQTHRDNCEKFHDEMTELYCSEPEQQSAIYFPTMTRAINHACTEANTRGYAVEVESLESVPYGSTVKHSFKLYKNEVLDKKHLHVQLYRMDSGTYELNFYIQ